MEVSSPEIRTPEFPPTEVSFHEDRPAQVCPREVRPCEIRPTEVRIGEVCSLKIRPAKVGATEITAAKVHIDKVSLGQVYGDAVHAAKVWFPNAGRGFAILLSPFIPCGYAPLEDTELLRVGHCLILGSGCRRAVFAWAGRFVKRDW